MNKKKMIKNLILLTVILTLTGCQNYLYEKTEAYLSPIEIKLLNQYYAEYASHGYNSTLRAVLRLRQQENKNYKSAVPFCDVLKFLQDEESKTLRISTKVGDSISQKWEKLKSETLVHSCNSLLFNNSENNSENDLSNITMSDEINYNIEKKSSDLIMVDGVKLLSPSKVLELKEFSKTCYRSKKKLSEITEGGHYLTEDDYETVINIQLDCAYQELNIELNKK